MKNPNAVYRFTILAGSSSEAFSIGGKILHNCTILSDEGLVAGFIRKDKLKAFLAMVRLFTSKPVKLITSERYMAPMQKRMTRSMNY